MPKRQTTKRIPSKEVQGEGSWVEVRPSKYGETKAAMRRREALGDDNEAILAEGEHFIIDHLVAWNWVDDDNQPLPLPKSDADLEHLTDDEVVFLTQAIRGSEKKGRN